MATSCAVKGGRLVIVGVDATVVVAVIRVRRVVITAQAQSRSRLGLLLQVSNNFSRRGIRTVVGNSQTDVDVSNASGARSRFNRHHGCIDSMDDTARTVYRGKDKVTFVGSE